jgi:hypothetical protein
VATAAQSDREYLARAQVSITSERLAAYCIYVFYAGNSSNAAAMLSEWLAVRLTDVRLIRSTLVGCRHSVGSLKRLERQD